ncbi:hypothetical protein KIH39_26445 [Telmatocola sphagniphila]|uniref:Uncharacterized protein n=1 Tax=Telmatocola sphagniphila TaxID=1123043 RepID=A0A8E6B8G2_9BACT|nr:hypothetical protein [Telmatocola sphagniphila]QVL32330.1 hypothetical protein KIH39_26445 [Telmatocola sphagniphila]
MSDSSFYERLENIATSKQLHQILRDLKKDHPKEIQVTGPKSDLVQRLRRAVDDGLIPITEVRSLLHECEENGHQHIWYYLPNSGSLSFCKNFKRFASQFEVKNEVDLSDFPKFKVTRGKLEWADFREEEISKQDKAGKWTIKFYGHEDRHQWDSPPIIKGNTITQHGKVVDDYYTAVVRWNPPDILELRLTITHSRAKLLARLEAIWQKLSFGIKFADCTPWDLSEARNNLFASRGVNSKRYQICTTTIIDPSSGSTSFSPRDSAELLEDERVRADAVKLFEQNGCKPSTFAVNWLDLPNKEQTELRTIITPRLTHNNEIVITSKTSSSTVDYVTRELRKFSS